MSLSLDDLISHMNSLTKVECPQRDRFKSVESAKNRILGFKTSLEKFSAIELFRTYKRLYGCSPAITSKEDFANKIVEWFIDQVEYHDPDILSPYYVEPGISLFIKDEDFYAALEKILDHRNQGSPGEVLDKLGIKWVGCNFTQMGPRA